MNMFARFDENPAMTLRVIKETKRYGRTDRQRENSIPPTNKVCGGIKNYFRNTIRVSNSLDPDQCSRLAIIISKYATQILDTQKRQLAFVHGMQDQKQSTFNTFKPAQ